MIQPNTLFSVEHFIKMPSYPDFGLILDSCNNDRAKAAARWAFLAFDRGFEFDEVMRELRRYLSYEKFDYLVLDTIAKDAWREVIREQASY
jgi:hypothetical protein